MSPVRPLGRTPEPSTKAPVRGLAKARRRAGAQPPAATPTRQLLDSLEAVADAAIVCDRDGHIVHLNAAACSLLAVESLPEFQAAPAEERMRLLVPRDEYGQPIGLDEWPLFRLLHGETLPASDAAIVQVRIVDGRELTVRVSGAPLCDSRGRLVGATLFLHDVSEDREMERRIDGAFNALLATAHTLIAAGNQVSAEQVPPLADNVAHRLQSAMQRLMEARTRLERAQQGMPPGFRSSGGRGASAASALPFSEQVSRQATWTSVEATAQALRSLGLAQWREAAFPTARSSLQRALDLLGDRVCTQRVHILIDLARLLTGHMGQPAEGALYAQQALQAAQQVGNTYLEVLAIRTDVECQLAVAPNLAAAQRALERALALADSTGDAQEIATCCFGLAAISYWLADIGRARGMAQRGLDLLGHHASERHTQQLRSLLGLLSASQGRWSEAEQALVVPQHLAAIASVPGALAYLRRVRGFLAHQREDHARAESELQAVGAHQRPSPLYLMPESDLLAVVEAAADRGPDARARLRDLEQLAESQPMGSIARAPALVILGLVAAALGEPAVAERVYGQLIAFQGQHYWYLVDHVLGRLADLRGDLPAAVLHLSAAEATARREGLQPELARVLVAEADLEAARQEEGRLARARDLLAEALSLGTALGMTSLAHETGARLAALTQRLDALLPEALPAGLSAREAEVLRLIAAGESNRQIALHLAISEKTVAHHLASVCAKTRSANRAAAAAYAVRHGLA